MLSLLDPRIWLAIAIAAALSFGAGFWKGNAHGESTVRAEWQSATAAANQESRRLEQARQRRADESAKLAAARTNRLAADSRRARSELDRLRSAVQSTAERIPEQPRAAADDAVRALSVVVGECSATLVEVARDADAARSEVKMLRDAWPQ
jgi:hypothetical protein